MKFVISNYDCDRILEDVAKNTTVLLALGVSFATFGPEEGVKQ